MFNLGMNEILFLVLIALILFGAKRLPDIGRSVAKTILEFKKTMQGDDKDNRGTGDGK